jgi:hypothetical protein
VSHHNGKIQREHGQTPELEEKVEVTCDEDESTRFGSRVWIELAQKWLITMVY